MWLPRTSRTPAARVQADRTGDHLTHPRPAGVDEQARRDGLDPPLPMLDTHLPQPVAADGGDDLGARHDPGAALLGIPGVEHDEATVLNPAVRVLERPAVGLLERQPGRIPGQVDAARAGQQLAPAQRVVERQTETDQPGGAPALHPRHGGVQEARGRGLALEPHVGMQRQDEAHGPGDMRHRAQQRLALDQALADEAHLEVFEVSQPAVKQLGRGRGRGGCQIVHLGQRDAEPPACGIPGDAAAVHAAADDEEVDGVLFADRIHVAETSESRAGSQVPRP